MEEKTKKRFRFLLNESEIRKVKELEDLIALTKHIHDENVEQAKALAGYRSQEKTFRSITLGHWDSFDGSIIIGLPYLMAALGALISLFIVLILWMSQGSVTNHLYLEQDGDNCTRIMREVEWGGDITESECYASTSNALTVMIQIQEAYNDGTYSPDRTDTNSSIGPDREPEGNPGEDERQSSYGY